jgi:beta-ureidopropionase
MAEVESLETLIEKSSSALDEREVSEMKRIIYGSLPLELELPPEAVKEANAGNFELKGYKFTAASEITRAPRITRIAVVQNEIVKPTTASILDQVTSCDWSCDWSCDMWSAEGSSLQTH